MNALRRLGVSVVLATLALVVMLGAKPIPVGTILAGYTLVLAAIAMAGLTAALREGQQRVPSRFEAELTRTRTGPTRPPDLVRAERELVLASSDPHHFARRLRPLLEEIAAARGARLDVRTEAPSLRELGLLIHQLEER